MPSDSYAASRADVNDILRACAAVSEAQHEVFNLLDRSEDGGHLFAPAVAARLVALITKGTELPSFDGFPIVLGGNGRRIRVFWLHAESSPALGFGASADTKLSEEYALVVFRRLVPVAVHLLDIERCNFAFEQMNVSLAAKSIGGPPWVGVTLNLLFHYNVMLEPLKAAAVGIRTFAIDAEAEVGWSSPYGGMGERDR